MSRARPNLEQIARELPTLLKREEPGEEPLNVSEIYDRYYRSESVASAHPSIGVLTRCVSWDPSGRPSGAGRASTLLAVSVTVGLLES